MAKQCSIYDKDNEIVNSGLLLSTGDVICGCCGGLIEKDNIGPENEKDFSIINIFDSWVNLNESILK